MTIVNLSEYKKKIVEKKYCTYEDDEIGFIVGWINEFGPKQDNEKIEWDEETLF